jgi:hypothetical protein
MSAPAFQSPAASPVPARDEVRAVLGAAVVNGFACAEIDSRRAVFSRGVCHEHLALYVDFHDGRVRSASLIGNWNDVNETRHRYDHPDEHPFDFIERLVLAADHVHIAAQSRSPILHESNTIRLIHSNRSAD